MKKLSVLLTASLVLFSTSALAVEAPANTATPVPTLTSAAPTEQAFTLEAAVDYAVKNHPMILAATANVTMNQTARDEAKSAFQNMDSKNAMIFDGGTTSFTVKKGLGLKGAEMKLLLSQKSLEQAISGVKNGVESQFYKYLGMVDKAKSAKDTYDLAVKKFEDIQKKKDVGMASDFDVLTFKVMVKQAQVNLNKINRDVESIEFGVKSALSLDSALKINLTGALEIPKVPEIKLEDAIAKAKENRFEVIKASQQSNYDKESFRVCGLWYEPITFKYQEAQYTVDSSNYNYLNSLNNVESSVRQNYNSMINAYDNLDLIDSNIELSDASYKLTQKKYEIGLSTSLEVSDAFQKLTDLKINRSDAVVNCILAENNFELSYSIGSSASNMNQ